MKARTLALGGGAFLLLLLAASVRTAGRPAFPVGKAMPEIELVTLEGQPWRLSEHRGEVVLLNFWATWCPPCRMETPGLVSVANEYSSKGLVVAGMSMDDGDLEAVRSFARQYRISYPILLPKQDSPLLSQISSLPTSVFIDRHGRVARTELGAISENAFRSQAERLLQQR